MYAQHAVRFLLTAIKKNIGKICKLSTMILYMYLLPRQSVNKHSNQQIVMYCHVHLSIGSLKIFVAFLYSS